AGLGELARDLALWLMGAVLFTYVALESSIATWWPAYLQERLGASGRIGGDVVTAFFVGVVVGRSLTARLVERWGPLRTLQLEAALAALAFPVAVLGQNLPVAALVVVTGLVAAGIWGTTLALAAERHPGQSGTVSGLLIAVGSLGSSLFPLWIGYTGDRWGLQAGFFTLELLLLVLVGIALLLGRKLHGRAVGRRDG
ncbi:MAG TPA: MFS transporter, partial [Limnochorda sp.]